MDEEVVLGIGLMVSVTVTVLTLARMYFNSRGGLRLSRQRVEAIEERLGRMEQAIDTIAVEVERISEGQRFTTKLLADRAGEADVTR